MINWPIDFTIIDSKYYPNFECYLLEIVCLPNSCKHDRIAKGFMLVLILVQGWFRIRYVSVYCNTKHFIQIGLCHKGGLYHAFVYMTHPKCSLFIFFFSEKKWIHYERIYNFMSDSVSDTYTAEKKVVSICDMK